MEKNVTCPLIFKNNEESSTTVEREQMVEYTPTGRQMDVWTGYEGRLRYERLKAQIELEKSAISLQQREQFEIRIKEMKHRFDLYLQSIHGTVYKDSSGYLDYALMSGDGQTITSKRLVNTWGYEAKLYISYGTNGKMALEISWGQERHAKIYFGDAQDGVCPKCFLKKLKSRGVMLLVSGRTEAKAAEALLAYSFSSAPIIELPFTTGWGRNSAGRWHFARRGEMTMEEVLKNV